jgi:3-phosphoshikimate 1-carboxyvinyltransferase
MAQVNSSKSASSVENREIIPAKQPLNAEISLPGSKYLANRLVIIAALANEPVVLRNVVHNDDIATAINGLAQLGYQIRWQNGTVQAAPRKAHLNDHSVDIFTSHSGTFSRFVAAVAALESRPVAISGSVKMNSRPMADLFNALTKLGASISADEQRLPAVIRGPITGDQVAIDGSVSSQYISALLLVAPLLNRDFTLELIGKEVSGQYIDMTVALMKQFGAQVEKQGRSYLIPQQQGYRGGEYLIPPDPVSSSYFMGAAAVCGGRVTLESFDFESLQGEAQFFKVLEAMGCDIECDGERLTLSRQGELQAVEVDMGDMPDVVQTLAAVACFARGTTVMKNIAHLAFKESNRIVDTARELRKLGARVDYGSDYLAVTGSELHGAEVETYDDHRMAMSLSLIGAKTPGVIINNAQVVSKSFPDYFAKLAAIGIASRKV